MLNLIIEIGAIIAIVHFVFHVSLAVMGTDMAAVFTTVKSWFTKS